MFYFLLPFLAVSILLLILGLISPKIIRKILYLRLTRPQIALFFGIIAIGFFALTYSTAPELKNFLHKDIKAVDRQTTTPTTPQITKPIYNDTSTNNSVPADPTAQCNDGTVSYSQNRQGTCSYHDGVKAWLE